ncbi:exodeoxyribonuclease V subunit alpha [Nocardioides marmoriginsengisoli]|uniref:RecBCD enzyme subunit RecD n=1 Tax=Nocardioides marmoriginsengisoli TaxID=661483 RepID=A0A3N0CAV7_9ACTN|nr:exodeoxyribonuclease V subunit alpha [Nocardioides marmoriginsengisoli]RNL60597.1 exodeoxyribonuclease V subunit alpha [Nocardioides marmoriginsengisoli]
MSPIPEVAAAGPDPYARRIAQRAPSLLGVFNRAGVLEASDVHVAVRLGALGDEADETVLLAVALAVRAARLGAVCVDLSAAPDQPLELLDEVTWPDPAGWRDAVAASPLTARGVLRHEGDLLYLDRHWREERQVCDDLLARLARRAPEVDEAVLAAAVPRLFPDGWDQQRDAALAAARRWTTVLTGGPGTGKTASVARMVALIAEQLELDADRAPRIALAAPTGKAAARLQESVAREAAGLDPVDRARLADLRASTLHRLLGWRPDSGTRFRHHRENPLSYDVVVVDEVSMVSLSQMARLLEAVRPTTRLILVGDADQLASVEAGAVLADLVNGFAGSADSPVLRLTQTHRTKAGAAGAELDALADALRQGDADLAFDLLTSGTDAVRLVDPADQEQLAGVRAEVTDAAYAVTRRALAFADPEDRVPLTDLLDEHRLLCAHREGPFGVSSWNRQVEHLLAERADVAHLDEWYPGRPILVTANDRGLGVSNGDIGVVARMPDGRLRVVVRTGTEVKLFAPTRLSGIETVYAMTVHKSQGSEARAVTVVLPPEDSALLTRELFYTAVTRAKEKVTIVGTEAALRAAIGRQVQRASGLAERLGGSS